MTVNDFKVGDHVVVTKDDVERLIGQTGIIISIDTDEYAGYPYFVEFDDLHSSGLYSDWVVEVELLGPPTIKPMIDPQVLADYLEERYQDGQIDPTNIFVISQRFNLPSPTPTKKRTMRVSMEIDVTDKGDDFTPLGDTYGAFVMLLVGSGLSSTTVARLEGLFNDNISVVIEEEDV